LLPPAPVTRAPLHAGHAPTRAPPTCRPVVPIGHLLRGTPHLRRTVVSEQTTTNPSALQMPSPNQRRPAVTVPRPLVSPSGKGSRLHAESPRVVLTRIPQQGGFQLGCFLTPLLARSSPAASSRQVGPHRISPRSVWMWIKSRCHCPLSHTLAATHLTLHDV
jgi:hypothetical protein